MVCKAGGITKDDIGAIRLTDDLSYVEIRQDAVEGFVAALGQSMAIEGKAVAQLDAAPELPDFKRPGGRKPFAKGKPPHRGSGPKTGRFEKPEGYKSKPKDGDRAPRAERPAPSKEELSPAKPRKQRSEMPTGPKKNGGPKGPPPPKGKPSSKKNRARALAKKQQKGGEAMPKRR